MKKLILLFGASVALSLVSSAQCSPDGQFTSPGFYPDSATGLPVSCVSVSYSEVITIIAPIDTTVSTPFGPTTVALDSVIILDVTGLPSGVSFTCQSPSCTWYPSANAASCILIDGTPITTGIYPVSVTYEGYITLFGTVVPYQDVENYSFEVQGCAGLNQLTLLNKELVKITDLMGREIKPVTGVPVIYHYSDGSVQRIIRIAE